MHRVDCSKEGRVLRISWFDFFSAALTRPRHDPMKILAKGLKRTPSESASYLIEYAY
jgi:hypothetical protein